MWIAYFPDDDYRDKSQAAPAYGPFDTEAQARAFARTLSTDPDEGLVRQIKLPVQHRPSPLTEGDLVRVTENAIQGDPELASYRGQIMTVATVLHPSYERDIETDGEHQFSSWELEKVRTRASGPV